MRTLPTTLALGGTAAAITAVLLRKHVLKQVSLALSVAKYSFMVFLIDMLPEKTRTEILSQEYTGEALEQRLKMRVFKGPRTVKALWRYSSINFYPQVAVGQPAPVTPVVALAGGREYTMLSELLSKFVEWQRECSGRADFVLCYLEEAHPTDGWLYEAVSHHLPQAKTFNERCEAAKILVEEMRTRDAPADLPLVVDSMSNTASYAYGALPERLVIIQRGVVRFIGGKGPEEYCVDEAKQALSALLEAYM